MMDDLFIRKYWRSRHAPIHCTLILMSKVQSVLAEVLIICGNYLKVSLVR